MYDEGEPHPERGLDSVLEALAPYGLRPEFQTLFICATCLELFDVIDLPTCRRERAELQQCLCHRVHEPTWPRYDYNEKARLCDCCGRYVLRSGSRWSVWFCDECNQRVRALNGRLGFAHIPVGRHSLMNNFSLSGPAIDEADIERFVERFEGMSDHIDLLSDQWKPTHIRSELERLGLTTTDGSQPGAISLVTYLSVVAAEDQRSTVDHRLQAFLGLAERFKVRELVGPNGKVRQHTTNG